MKKLSASLTLAAVLQGRSVTKWVLSLKTSLCFALRSWASSCHTSTTRSKSTFRTSFFQQQLGRRQVYVHSVIPNTLFLRLDLLPACPCVEPPAHIFFHPPASYVALSYVVVSRIFYIIPHYGTSRLYLFSTWNENTNKFNCF